MFYCEDVWGNELAAKVLKSSGAEFAAIEQKARGELDALTTVRHPNVVHVYDAFVFHGACYIISERCGETLKELLTNSMPTRQWFLPIARCLLQAIHFTHVQGIAHCDIHPGNVFARVIPDEVSPADFSAVTFKLGDYGLARSGDDVNPDGTFLNSIRAPEAIDPEEFGPADHRIDIYHAGLLLLQVWEGTLLTFSREEILSGVPRNRALTLPEPYASAIEKMVRRHAIHRTSSALAVWRDLKSAAQSDRAA